MPAGRPADASIRGGVHGGIASDIKAGPIVDRPDEANQRTNACSTSFNGSVFRSYRPLTYCLAPAPRRPTGRQAVSVHRLQPPPNLTLAIDSRRPSFFDILSTTPDSVAAAASPSRASTAAAAAADRRQTSDCEPWTRCRSSQYFNGT